MSTTEETAVSGSAVKDSASRGVVEALRGRLIGIDLVDLLFALVVFELLAPLREPGEVVLAGWWHLAVALTLTLLSWMATTPALEPLTSAVSRRPNRPSGIYCLMLRWSSSTGSPR